jgi:hypothetical protein
VDFHQKVLEKRNIVVYKYTMKENKTSREEREIMLLKERLPKISNECRAYIKGASQALLYAQEGNLNIFTSADVKQRGKK